MKTIGTTPGPRYAALLELLQVAEVIWNRSRLFFARWGLSPSQFNVLNLLRDLPQGLSQVELSRRLIMHRSNVTGLVDRLEARGLLQRQDTPGDRRAYHVVLTPAGQRLVQDILPPYYAAAEEVWGSLTVSRANQLVRDLHQVSSRAEQIAARLQEQPPSTNPAKAV